MHTRKYKDSPDPIFGWAAQDYGIRGLKSYTHNYLHADGQVSCSLTN